MKIKEVSVTPAGVLAEQLGLDNQTGYSTEDLVKIVQTEQAGQWSDVMSLEEMFAEMDKLDEDYDAGRV